MRRPSKFTVFYFWLCVLACLFAAFLFAAPAASAQSAFTEPYVKSIQVQDTTYSRLIATTPMVIEYTPQRIYGRWLREVAECAGLSVPIEELRKMRFFAINASTFQINEDTLTRRTIGVADVFVSTMFLSMAYILNEHTVKHEFLHFLKAWASPFYIGGHDADFITCT